MSKSDKSIKSVTIAAIQRHVIHSLDCNHTVMFEEGDVPGIFDHLEFEDKEELICATIISELVWTVVSSRRIFTLEGKDLRSHVLEHVAFRDVGDFKGWSKQAYTKGFLVFEDGVVMPYFIETGQASLVIIYGIDTVVNLRSNPEG